MNQGVFSGKVTKLNRREKVTFMTIEGMADTEHKTYQDFTDFSGILSSVNEDDQIRVKYHLSASKPTNEKYYRTQLIADEIKIEVQAQPVQQVPSAPDPLQQQLPNMPDDDDLPF